jgi:hypothetical protein
MDKITRIVEQAIQYTEEILSREPKHFGAACDGLERMRNSLAIGAEDHQALGRLSAYIGELSRRFGN